MPTTYSSLLGLALPATGELSGAWGDTVNNYITQYLDAAIAGAQTISGSQTAVTLSVANGTSLSVAGTGTTGSAQYQIINCTGNPASLLTVTVPASSRKYLVLNATSTSQSVKIVGAGPTTGVTLVSGEKALIAWNGSDFVKVASTAAAGSTTQVQYNSGGLLAGSSNFVFTGTNLGIGNASPAAKLDVGGDALVNGVTVGLGTSGTATNTAVGASALLAHSSGANNTAIGYRTLFSLVTGSLNTAVGHQALYANTAASNTAVGSFALTSNTSGTNNTALGSSALFTNTTGNYNTAVGLDALRTNSNSGGNTAVGYRAAYRNTASDNTVIGYNALQAAGTGGANTAVGGQALFACSSGTSNVAVGNTALISNNTGNYNVAIGASALLNCTSGSTNIAIGLSAASTLGIGTSSIFIGSGCEPSAYNNTNEIVIGAAASTTGRGSNTAYINANGGATYNGANTTTWATVSDERIKTNFKAVTNGLAVVVALQPQEFDYISTGKHDVGFRAQQYMQVLPDQVGKHAASEAEKELVKEDTVYGIQRNLDPYFVSAIQTLATQVAELKARIEVLESKYERSCLGSG